MSRRHSPEIVPSVISVLYHALTYLDEHGWAQKQFATHSGQVCLFGALSRVTEEGPVRMRAMDEVALTLSAGRTKEHFYIAEWNDSLSRRWTQVKQAVTDTIERLEVPPSAEPEAKPVFKASHPVLKRTGRSRGPVKPSRGVACCHVGMMWDPPVEEVVKVKCRHCNAYSGFDCFRGGKHTLPCANRYVQHHLLNCSNPKAKEWTR